MYDKYFTANQFSLGSTKLPKHKGILFSGGTATTGSSTIHVLNNGPTGATAALTLVINQSPYILPMQVYAVTALATGVTAWYIT
jgi:hypothetical protein